MKAVHDNNFWILNPELLIIKEFEDLRNKDISKDKSDSSKIMWAIYYITNPDSIFVNVGDKLNIVAKNFLKNEKFNWSSIKKEIALYREIVLSDAERALINWGEIMTMRDNSLKELYKTALGLSDVKSLQELDKMLTNTPKMFADYKKIREDFEGDKLKKKGAKTVSLNKNKDF